MKENSLAETLAAVAIAGLNITASIWISMWGGLCIRELYGDSIQFSWITQFSLHGYLWAPIIIGLAMLIFIIIRLWRRNNKWSFWVLAIIASSVTSFIAYGINQPFSSTTFSLSAG